MQGRIFIAIDWTKVHKKRLFEKNLKGIGEDPQKVGISIKTYIVDVLAEETAFIQQLII